MSGAALSYLLMVIPTMFALVVVGQGIYKINHQEKDGQVALGFGITFLLIIGIAYWLFIR